MAGRSDDNMMLRVQLCSSYPGETSMRGLPE